MLGGPQSRSGRGGKEKNSGKVNIAPVVASNPHTLVMLKENEVTNRKSIKIRVFYVPEKVNQNYRL
jgi:hypothetical protein